MSELVIGMACLSRLSKEACTLKVRLLLESLSLYTALHWLAKAVCFNLCCIHAGALAQ